MLGKANDLKPLGLSGRVHFSRAVAAVRILGVGVQVCENHAVVFLGVRGVPASRGGRKVAVCCQYEP